MPGSCRLESARAGVATAPRHDPRPSPLAQADARNASSADRACADGRRAAGPPASCSSAPRAARGARARVTTPRRLTPTRGLGGGRARRTSAADPPDARPSSSSARRRARRRARSSRTLPGQAWALQRPRRPARWRAPQRESPRPGRRKSSARSSTSSRASRSGGSRCGTTAQPIEQVLAEPALPTSSADRGWSPR